MNTRRLYVRGAGRWLAAGGSPGHIEAELVWRFLAARRRAVGLAAVNIDLKAMRAFYRCMEAHGVATVGTVDRIPPMRRQVPRLVRWYSDDQVAALLAAPDRSTWQGVRDHAVLRVLADTGLRGSEVARLARGDVLPEGWVFVRGGKGGRDRYVPCTSGLTLAILEWERRRGEARPGKRSELFVTQGGRPFSGSGTVWAILQRYARAALGANVAIGKVDGRSVARGKPWQGHYPHLLRASLATSLLAHEMPTTAIAVVLGHADVATTALYQGVDLTVLKREHGKLPRNRR